MELDKKYLLLYTDLGKDGMRHSFHAWFLSEKELRRFVKKKKKEKSFQDEFAIKIKNHRFIEV